MKTWTQHGLTLLELMITLLVAGMLVMLAVPSIQGMLERHRLRGAVEIVSTALEMAKLESVKRNTAVSVAFDTDEWCYGLQDGEITAETTCDCTADGDCTVGGEQMVGDGNAFSGVGMTEVQFGAVSFVTWDPVRGTAGAGRVCLKTSDNGLKANILVSVLGRVRICSPNVSYYASCTNDTCP